MSSTQAIQRIYNEIICTVTGDHLSARDQKEIWKVLGKGGYTLTAPDLIDIRIHVPFDNAMWTDWHTPLSEEAYGLNVKGEKLYIVNHPNRVLRTSERIDEVMEDDTLPHDFARLNPQEFLGLQRDGNVVYVDDLRGGRISLPEEYTVIGKVHGMKFGSSGYQKIADLRKDDVFLMRCGSEERREKFLKKLEGKYSKYGNYHALDDVSYEIPGVRPLFLSFLNDGLAGALKYHWRLIATQEPHRTGATREAFEASLAEKRASVK